MDNPIDPSLPEPPSIVTVGAVEYFSPPLSNVIPVSTPVDSLRTAVPDASTSGVPPLKVIVGNLTYPLPPLLPMVIEATIYPRVVVPEPLTAYALSIASLVRVAVGANVHLPPPDAST